MRGTIAGGSVPAVVWLCSVIPVLSRKARCVFPLPFSLVCGLI